MARYPDPVLRRAAAPVDAFGPELGSVAEALAATARLEGAVGLAANQAGVDARVIVLDPEVLGPGGSSVLVNPRIVERTPEVDMRFWRERCLALPSDVRVTLMRDSGVTVRSQDLTGHLQTQNLRGEAARALQHELDHLNGILIVDHATDPEDLQSELFPEMWDLEQAEHARRQARAFERSVEEAALG